MMDDATRRNISRREFNGMALGALGAAAVTSHRAAASEQRWAAGIKLCVQSSATPSDEQLLFLKQLGAAYVSVGAPPDLRTAEGFVQIKQRYADAGITVWNIGNTSVHNMPEVTLNLPGRDQKIEEYKHYILNLGKAGISYSTYAHMGNGIWTSGRTPVRGASAREFDQNSPEARGNWDGKVFTGPLSHGREFTPDEIWENYTHFIKQVAPVAEEARRSHRHSPRRSAGAGSRRCAAASSATTRATSGRWRLPTVQMSAFACAVERGSKAARS